MYISGGYVQSVKVVQQFDLDFKKLKLILQSIILNLNEYTKLAGLQVIDDIFDATIVTLSFLFRMTELTMQIMSLKGEYFVPFLSVNDCFKSR